MKKLIDCAIALAGLLAAAYMWPVSETLTFAVIGSLYGLLMWRFVSNAKQEKKNRR